MLMNNKGEVRIGRYDDYERVPELLNRNDGKANMYLNLNPIRLDIESKVPNGIVRNMKSISDSDIEKYLFILIDLDPIRKSKISSTDEEHNYALRKAEEVKKYICSMRLPEPIIADSGNGAHVLVPVDIENNKENALVIKNLLRSLDTKYSDDKVKIDVTTSNPARLTRFYGTVTCKGRNTEERPHRKSGIISIGDNTRRATLEEIKTLINDLSPSQYVDNVDNKNYTKNNLTKVGYGLKEVLIKNGIDVSHTKDIEDGLIHVLRICPFNNKHTDKSAYIMEFNNGNIVAGCHHDSCSDNNWSVLKKQYGINYFNKNIDNIDVKPEKKETQEDIILEIVNNLEIIKSNLNEVYVKIDIKDRTEYVNIEHKKFQSWIGLKYYEHKGRMPNNENIQKAIKLLQGKAMLEEESIVEKRCCKVNGNIYYDLANKEGDVVKISKEGWEIISEPPFLFQKSNTMLEQDLPIKYNDISILDKYFRYKDEQHLTLQKVVLMSLFMDDIQRPITVLHGEKGSAKTSTMRTIRQIVDPSRVPTVSMSRSRDDTVITMYNNYLVCFDNIDRISPDISDLLCTAVTGGGDSKRKLYTDSEEQVVYFKKGIVLNGINVVATRPDLLDRSILMELERIPANERKEEAELNKQLKEDMPKILGSIFTTISEAMKIYDNIKLDKLGRLSDFTKWGYAIAEASGIGGDKFLNAYLNNQKEANYEAIVSNPLGLAISKFIEDSRRWEGKPAELLEILIKVAEEENINMNDKMWPKASNVLSRRINEIKSNLQDMGIEIEIIRSSERKIIISKQD